MKTSFSTVRIGDVAKVRSGYAFKSKDWIDSGIPVVKIANVKDGELVMDGCSFVSESIAEDAKEWRLREGDILIAMTGYIGDVARVRGNAPRLLNQRVGRFEIVSERSCDPDFLYYTLRSPEIKRDIEGHGYGSAQPNVSPKLIQSVAIPLPSLDEQRAIVSVLGALDNKIEQNRCTARALEQLARVIFRAWFVDFEPVKAKAAGATSFLSMPQTAFDILPTTFVDSDIGLVPEGWELKALGDLLVLHYGKALKADVRQSGAVPVYGSNGQVGWHNEAIAAGPGIVVGRKGNPGTVRWLQEPFFPIDTAFFVETTDARTSLPLLFYQLEMADLSRLAADSAVPGVNRNMIYAEQCIVPRGPILATFDSLMLEQKALQTALTRESRKLAKMRDYLLPRLLSGSVRVEASNG